jgi:hypothetical protein
LKLTKEDFEKAIEEQTHRINEIEITKYVLLGARGENQKWLKKLTEEPKEEDEQGTEE